MNGLQDYMVREYVWDYREGRLSRRDLIRRVLLITGSVSATAALLGGMRLPEVADAATPVAQATSPLSVPADAPTIDAQDISFEVNGTTLLAYQARPKSATGPLSALSHPSGACFPHDDLRISKPGMERAAMVSSGPAAMVFTRTLRGPSSRAR